MTTRRDKQRPASSNLGTPDEDTAHQALSPIAVLASMIARPAPDIGQDRRRPLKLKPGLVSARIYGAPVPPRDGDLECDMPSAARSVAALATARRQRVIVGLRMGARREDRGACVMMDGDSPIDAVDASGPILNRLRSLCNVRRAHPRVSVSLR